MINSQGAKIYVGQIPATEWGSCGEAITALKGSPIVECPQSVGDVGAVSYTHLTLPTICSV